MKESKTWNYTKIVLDEVQWLPEGNVIQTRPILALKHVKATMGGPFVTLSLNISVNYCTDDDVTFMIQLCGL